MLAAADLAMYEAKQTGRDRVAVFAPELQHEVRSGRSWADRIRCALDEDTFELFCQPIVDLRTGKTSQWEVLLRLRDDDGKIVSPDAFLPLAERFDLIQQIDRWVALGAIEVMEERLRGGERVRLEVNLSAKSLVDPAFMDAVEAAITASTIDPADLIFEVTETAAIANMDEARAFSERLRRLGLRLRARRLRLGLRVVLLPQAPAGRLREDRRRLHPRADDEHASTSRSSPR